MYNGLTLTQAKKLLSDNGISLKKTGHGQELRVAYKGEGNESTAYYTECLDDAVNTAMNHFNTN